MKRISVMLYLIACIVCLDFTVAFHFGHGIRASTTTNLYRLKMTASGDGMKENDMTLDELKAELDLRGIEYSDCFTKNELAKRLSESRVMGRADPTIIDNFNEAISTNSESGGPIIDEDILNNIDAEDVTAQDGSMPGGLPPEMMKAMAKDPEIMNMLGDPKMQEIMKTMMSGGPDAMKKYMSDPDAVALLGKLSQAIQRVGGPGI